MKQKLLLFWTTVKNLDIVTKCLGLLLGILAIRPLGDPDFGWHLTDGINIIKNHAIPYLDPYSYTMPDWRWVNHEWLTDVLMAILHWAITPLGLSIVFGLLSGLAFFIASGTHTKQLHYRIIGATLGLLAGLPILGVRAQVISLIGLAATLYYLYAYQRGERKDLWIFLPLFLIWANLHGGFIMGLFAMFVFFAVEAVKYAIARIRPKFAKKLWEKWEETLPAAKLRHLMIIGALSGAVTFVNPHGWRLFYDIYITLSNKFTLENIAEWRAVTLQNPISYDYAIYIVILLLLMAFAYRKLQPTRLVMMGVFLYLSLIHWRNMPLFMITSAGLMTEIIAEQTSMVYDGLIKNRLITLVMLTITVILVGQRIADVVPKSFNITLNLEAAGYPIDAINWVKAHPDKVGTRVFNDYGWGGTMIWQLPEYKVFIDGRMGYWIIGDRFPFYQSQNMTQAMPGTFELLDKYKIDWTLIQHGEPLDFLLHGHPESWKMVYADGLSVIYTRIK